MPNVTSSVLGASLTRSDSTQLFALNQVIRGSDASEWQYVVTTGTLTTGMMVTINTDGTAIAAASSNLVAPDGTVGYSLGFAQFSISGLMYGFVAKRGHNMYIRTSGTVAPLNVLYLQTGSNTVIGTAATACTLGGIYITTSASTATIATAIGILTYPRAAGVTNTPIG